jgi:DnaJ-class molecular chaperone
MAIDPKDNPGSVQRSVLPQPDQECHYCRGTGKVWDWASVSTGTQSMCKPCGGKGRRPVRQNDKAEAPENKI